MNGSRISCWACRLCVRVAASLLFPLAGFALAVSALPGAFVAVLERGSLLLGVSSVAALTLAMS
ncbi:MAG: hypothetical protein ABIS68_02965 [Casimicrobiaceae bacterium]